MTSFYNDVNSGRVPRDLSLTHFKSSGSSSSTKGNAVQVTTNTLTSAGVSASVLVTETVWASPTFNSLSGAVPLGDSGIVGSVLSVGTSPAEAAWGTTIWLSPGLVDWIVPVNPSSSNNGNGNATAVQGGVMQGVGDVIIPTATVIIVDVIVPTVAVIIVDSMPPTVSAIIVDGVPNLYPPTYTSVPLTLGTAGNLGGGPGVHLVDYGSILWYDTLQTVSWTLSVASSATRAVVVSLPTDLSLSVSINGAVIGIAPPNTVWTSPSFEWVGGKLTLTLQCVSYSGSGNVQQVNPVFI